MAEEWREDDQRQWDRGRVSEKIVNVNSLRLNLGNDNKERDSLRADLFSRLILPVFVGSKLPRRPAPTSPCTYFTSVGKSHLQQAQGEVGAGLARSGSRSDQNGV